MFNNLNIVQGNSFLKLPANNNFNLLRYNNTLNLKLKNLKKDTFQTSFKGYSLSQDKDWQNLKDLADKVKSTQDIEFKRKLWEQERIILEQELKDPAKYLDRVKRTNGMEVVPENYQDQLTQVRINSLKGLITYVIPLKDMGEKRNIDPAFYYPLFESFIKETPDNSPLAEELKTWTLHLSSAMYNDIDNIYKKQAEDLAIYAFMNSSFNQCKTIALNLFAGHVDKNKPVVKNIQETFLNNWKKKDINNNEREITLIALGKLETPELKNIIPEVLSDKSNIHSDKLKLIATWCAGRVKSQENFRLLSNIINKSIKEFSDTASDNNLKISEMALASIVEYSDKNAEEVKNILKTILEKDTPLKVIADAYLEKLDGNNLIQDFYIHKTIKSETEETDYKKLRKDYVDGMESLDTEQMNWLDRGLLPFRKFLDFFRFTNSRMVILDGTASSVDKSLTGKRTGDGRFWDMITGVETGGGKKSVIAVCDFKEPFKSKSHISGHEMSHQVLKYLMKFDKDEYNELKRLFEKAKNDDKCLDLYSASDIEEFWAVAYETFLLIYKPHKDLIDFEEKQVGTANTRAVLKRKDPELFEFIQHIINKYGISEIGVQKAKKAYKESKNTVVHIKIS
ncbi:MAG: hypothetical protein AB1782_15370 [Cyanobacteriota bacterium]